MPQTSAPSDFVQSVKTQLHYALPDVRSSHLSEALAAAYGYSTHASFLAAIKDGLNPYQVTLSDTSLAAFNDRLRSMGERVQASSWLSVFIRRRPIRVELLCSPSSPGLYNWGLSHDGDLVDGGSHESGVLACILSAACSSYLIDVDIVTLKFKGDRVLAFAVWEIQDKLDLISDFLDDYFERRREAFS